MCEFRHITELHQVNKVLMGGKLVSHYNFILIFLAECWSVLKSECGAQDISTKEQKKSIQYSQGFWKGLSERFPN